MDYQKIIDQFREACEAHGLIIDRPIQHGVKQKWSVEGGKPRNNAGFTALYLDHPVGGIIYNHRLDEAEAQIHWKPDIQVEPLTEQQRKDLSVRIEENERRREAEKLAKEETLAGWAERRWKSIRGGDVRSRYLVSKGVVASCIKVTMSGSLVIPMRDVDGKIWSLQTIEPDGEKRFAENGRVNGTMHLLGNVVDGDPIGIAEGYATAATAYREAQIPVAAAFVSGNLEHVAKALAGKYPHSPIIVFADNDQHLVEKGMNNAGIEAAQAAAKAVDGYVLAPPVAGDWNDYAQKFGSMATEEEIGEQLTGLGIRDLLPYRQSMGMGK